MVTSQNSDTYGFVEIQLGLVDSQYTETVRVGYTVTESWSCTCVETTDTPPSEGRFDQYALALT